MEYNPLDKANLGISVRDALLRQTPLAMSPWPTRFDGAGIYTLYYTGDFPAYQRIAIQNREGKFDQPIYVGKAVPAGARKGGTRMSSAKATGNLYARIREHARSIESAKSTLRIEDFYFRYLTVDDIWIPLGETYIIDKFEPLWNKVVEGFGIHTPGTRRRQYTSPWDMLHPGRDFVSRLELPPNPKSVQAILKEIRTFLALSPEEQARMPVKEYGVD